MPDLIRGRQCLPLCKGRWHGALRRDGGVADTKPAQKSTYQSLSQPIGCQLPLHKGAHGCGTDTRRMTGAAGGDRYLAASFAAAPVERCKSGIAMVRNVRKHLIRLAMLGTFSARRRLGCWARTFHMTQLRIIPKEVFHMTDRTLSEFTAQLASASPAPGGGGAAALTGALAASLAAMAANVTAANPRYAKRTDALATLAAACDAQRTALLTLIDADAAGFLPLQRAYAIPKTDPARSRARGQRRARRVGPAGYAGALRAGGAAAGRRARGGQPPPCARTSGVRRPCAARRRRPRP